MPSPETLSRFIARVEQNAHVEAIEEFYWPDASMQENMGLPRVGRDALVANERRALSRVKSVQSRCIGPALVQGNLVVIRWHFRFEGLDGQVRELEELAYQQWHGERILKEQFFYDPAQFAPHPPQPDVDALKHFFEAINRNDMEAMTRDFDPDILRVEPTGFDTAGTFRGVDAVREQVRQGRGTWAEGSCNPEGFFTHGDKVVVYLHAWVRLKANDEWIGGHFADGFVFRNGKITEYRTFWERPEALAWAGIEAT